MINITKKNNISITKEECLAILRLVNNRILQTNILNDLNAWDNEEDKKICNDTYDEYFHIYIKLNKFLNPSFWL